MRVKKSLGQHFLISKSIVGMIANAAHLRNTDTVLEIGPGKGILTRMLLQRVGKVIAVEKDKELVAKLRDTFLSEIEAGKLSVIYGDILTLPIEKYIDDTFKVVANIPYYITGNILRTLLSLERQPKLMVLMLQKEVAKRIVARDNKESLLSLSVKAYGKPRYIETIPARFFRPKPKVDSAILAIEHISRSSFKDIREEQFFSLIKHGFAHKRKKLARNIEGLFEEKNIEEIFNTLYIKKTSRAEELSLEKWFALTNEM